MTRNDFEILARHLKALKPPPADGDTYLAGRMIQWEHTVEEIAAMCSYFQPRFNEERFYKACNKGE